MSTHQETIDYYNRTFLDKDFDEPVFEPNNSRFSYNHEYLNAKEETF